MRNGSQGRCLNSCFLLIKIKILNLFITILKPTGKKGQNELLFSTFLKLLDAFEMTPNWGKQYWHP